MGGGFTHVPVMPAECLEALMVRPDGVYVDCTAGGGGHSLLIAKSLGPAGRLICIDRDMDAIHACEERLAGYRARVTLVHARYSSLRRLLSSLGLDGADGIFMDLGVSSHQLDTAARGFSFQKDAPLDMRMDTSVGETAKDLVNRLPADELAEILWKYGEERYSRRIAERIERSRRTAAIETTKQLADIIVSAIPAAARRAEQQHPAKRSFQALRIAVNGELDELAEVLDELPQLLHPSGRAAVLTFHSLEDRLVKAAFARHSTGCTCPPDLPVCVCGHKPTMRVITKKPILPTQEELQHNRRAASAKLRVAQRL